MRARALLLHRGMEARVGHVDPSHWANLVMRTGGSAFRLYHRHRVEGLEHLTAAFAAGPVVLVGNHCLDLVDPLMLTVAIGHAEG
jgi:1-acyl-sn-glycerol-3-phosphate acyltransferase